MGVDLQRLPLRSPVLELRPEAGRTRVTFKRLAAIYYLPDDHPAHAAILAALERSLDTGDEVELTYELTTKNLAGLGPVEPT